MLYPSFTPESNFTFGALNASVKQNTVKENLEDWVSSLSNLSFNTFDSGDNGASITANDSVVFLNATTADFTINLPQISTLPFTKPITFKNVSTGWRTITILASGSDTIENYNLPTLENTSSFKMDIPKSTLTLLPIAGVWRIIDFQYPKVFTDLFFSSGNIIMNNTALTKIPNLDSPANDTYGLFSATNANLVARTAGIYALTGILMAFPFSSTPVEPWIRKNGNGYRKIGENVVRNNFSQTIKLDKNDTLDFAVLGYANVYTSGADSFIQFSLLQPLQ
jgi:hypothetical protein